MVASLIIVAAVCLGGAAVWVIPAVALGAALSLVVPTFSSGSWIVFGALVLAVPAAAGLAGALLDRVVRSDDHTGAPIFRVLLVALAGGMVATTVDLPTFIGTAVHVSRGVGPTDVFAALARIIAVICFCGGSVALVALGWLALLEVPIRWLLGVARVRAFDLSVGAIRPFVFVLVVGSTLQLVAGLWAREIARVMHGG